MIILSPSRMTETKDRRSGRPTVLVWCALAVVVLFFLLALVGDRLLLQDPDRQDLLLGAAGASSDHRLGTDELGRDVLSRLVVGTRAALAGPLLVALSTLVVGSGLGLAAGVRGGRLDTMVSRFAELVWSLPGLLVAIVVIGVLQGGTWLMIAVIAFLSTPHAIRQTRSATLAQVRLPYIAAARTLGLGRGRIALRHVLPNVRATVLTTFLLDFVTAILIFSALAFLRIGVAPGTPTWGSMLADGQTLIPVNPWLMAGPGIAIALVAASVTVLGDWIHDVQAGSADR